MSDLPIPPSVLEWFDEFLVDANQAPAFCIYADGYDQKFEYVRAAVYAQLWRDEAELQHPVTLAREVAQDNVQICVQRMNELSK